MPFLVPIIKLLLYSSLLVTGLPLQAQADAEKSETMLREGLAWHERGFPSKAFPKLEKAADLGYTEAFYYAGRFIQRRGELNREAEAFYQQAADRGRIYALLRLAQKDYDCSGLWSCWMDQDEWLDKALDLVLPRAESGNPEAMKAVHSIYRAQNNSGDEWEWIQRAAEAGHAYSQYRLAYLIDGQEKGFYWTKAGRQEDARKWLQKAAKNGYPKAMSKLAIKLREQGELEEARYWVEAMAQTDYYDAVLEAGAQIMMGPDIAEVYSPTISYHFEAPRPIEGAALLLALHRNTGRPATLDAIKAYEDYLTPEMLAEALERSEELLTDTAIFF
ncbi:tetratricopeptide repeat protein [Marinobacter sp. GN3S48]|uniref:tetratricopeptide repeat protein n=1 Tax=Marinobacter sp. GN3S48 TaxID=3382302 RepID=UPI00387AB748